MQFSSATNEEPCLAFSNLLLLEPQLANMKMVFGKRSSPAKAKPTPFVCPAKFPGLHPSHMTRLNMRSNAFGVAFKIMRIIRTEHDIVMHSTQNYMINKTLTFVDIKPDVVYDYYPAVEDFRYPDGTTGHRNPEEATASSITFEGALGSAESAQGTLQSILEIMVVNHIPVVWGTGVENALLDVAMGNEATTEGATESGTDVSNWFQNIELLSEFEASVMSLNEGDHLACRWIALRLSGFKVLAGELGAFEGSALDLDEQQRALIADGRANRDERIKFSLQGKATWKTCAWVLPIAGTDRFAAGLRLPSTHGDAVDISGHAPGFQPAVEEEEETSKRHLPESSESSASPPKRAC